MSVQAKNLLTMKEVCDLFQVKQATIRSWVFYRKIQFVKVGRLIRFHKDVIEKFIEENTIKVRCSMS